MISLCMVIHNQGNYLRRALTSAKDLVNEIVIVDQGSTDQTVNIAKEFADVLVRKRLKGNADPDREYCASLARGEWILFLDADEYLSPMLQKKIPKLAVDRFMDVFWIKFKNLVNGRDIKDILGDDWHPRLYRKGAVVWSAQAHVHPEIKAPMQAWVDAPIIHDRTLKAIEETHKLRGPFIHPESREKEVQFIKKVKEMIG